MNKESILEAFYNEKPESTQLLAFLSQNPEMATSEPQDPCNFLCELEEEPRNKLFDHSDQSTYSEIGISLDKYNQVLADRQNQKIFAALSDNQNLEFKLWFYRTPEQKTFGPFSAVQMDGFFQTAKLTENCYVQSPTDSNFVDLRMIIRGYLKKLQVKKTEEVKGIRHSTSKADKTRNQAKTAGLLIERKYRILSQEIKASFAFLDEIGEDCEFTETIQTRARSSTVGQ